MNPKMGIKWVSIYACIHCVCIYIYIYIYIAYFSCGSCACGTHQRHFHEMRGVGLYVKPISPTKGKDRNKIQEKRIVSLCIWLIELLCICVH
jgi:hypothetical protein